MAVSTEARFSQINNSEIFIKQDTQPIPHHLLDTKIFAALGSNDVLEVRPSVVNFHGFEIGKIYRKKLRILNVAPNCQRLHIIPPENDHFKITYTKNESLVPGMYVDVTVEFTPFENDYHYNDCIRVHCESSSNLVIPIHAYMILNVADSLPSTVSFKPTLIGQSMTKEYTLKNPTLCSFDFQISFTEKHQAFSIEPMDGIIGADSEVTLKITFRPLEYVTACSCIKIFVSHFNSEPFFCKLTGCSQPGLAVENKKKEIACEESNKKVTDPRVLSPLWRSRSKKLQSTIKSQQPKAKEVVMDGIRFPVNLNNPAAVSYVLTQQPGKLKAKDVREAVKTNDKSHLLSHKQMKEAMFEHMVRENIEKEEKNQLRWCVRLGEEEISDEERNNIVKERDKHEKEYALFLGEAAQPRDFKRTENIGIYTRITRPPETAYMKDPTYDIYESDDWDKRHALMKKFIQAARKVMIRQRVSRHLKELRKHLESWRKGDFLSSAPRLANSLNVEQQIVEKLKVDHNEPLFEPITFHRKFSFNNPMEWKEMGKVDVPDIEIKLEPHFKTYSLKVPQQYKILSYSQHPVNHSVRSYIPKQSARKLRTKNGTTKPLLTDKTENATTKPSLTEKQQNLSESKQETMSKQETVKSRTTNNSSSNEKSNDRIPFPKRLLKPPKFHPLHVFNPLPGVIAHAEDIPYSEVDDDYRLCPIPRPGMPGQLDHEDVIADTMLWKKFPSNALVVASSWPTISDVHVPQFDTLCEDDDYFTEDIPAFLHELPADDVIDEADEVRDYSSVTPMQMMASHFGKDIDFEIANKTDGWQAHLNVDMLPTHNNPNFEGGRLTRETMLDYLDKHVDQLTQENYKRLQEKIDSQKDAFELS